MKAIGRAILAAALLAGLATPSFAQLMPSVTPAALAARLRAVGVSPGAGFRATRSVNCIPRHPGVDWAFHCVVPMADGQRGGGLAALEVMIFDGRYDFAAKDAQIGAAVARMPGRWALNFGISSTLQRRGQKFSVHGMCRQSRGQPNSAAFCLLPVTPNVLVFTQVPPAERNSTRVTTNANGGPDSFDDMAHAGTLATIGATTVAEASMPRPAPRAAPHEQVLSPSIWKQDPGEH